MRVFISLSLFFFLSAGPLFSASIAVITGDLSLSESERRYATSLSRHIVRWYREAGVSVDLSTDRDLNHSLRGKKSAVLVYMASPKANQIAALRSFVNQGGKLIVFYSSSRELASLMGMKTVGYRRADQPGRWSQMRFGEQRPAGTPAQVRQSSKNLFVLSAIPGQSSVIAWWHTREGMRTAEPAWLASRAGYWMTHVLSADGDSAAKGRMLLALAAHFDPSLWKVAARDALTRVKQVVARVEGAYRESMGTPRLERAYRGMKSLLKEGEGLLVRGQAYKAWNAAQDLRSRCYEVYGVMQKPRNGEIRAVWDHSGQGLYPGHWDRTCSLLKEAGFTDLYVNVAGAGFAHYASAILPRSKVFSEQGDQLDACIRAAHRSGLRVHAWILCFTTEGATADRIAIFRKRGWLLSDTASRPSLDPAHPEVRNYLARAVAEMASKYQVDGVHFDYVRYPDFNSCLGENVRSRFERAVSRRVPNWPEDIKAGPYRFLFINWRAKQVSDFVQLSRRLMRRDAPGKWITAAVYGKYPSCLAAVGQDWESWLNTGMVDYVTPMNYSSDMQKFKGWLSAQARTRSRAIRIVSGIGVTAAESRLNPIQVIDQIKAVRQAGCSGFALFDLDMALQQEILPILRLGALAPCRKNKN